MKSPKKSKPKPKQRTNWKQRALDCEEVIGVQNQIAKFREQKLAEITDSFRLERSRATFYETQCEAAAKARIEAVDKLAAAEKHNALLLEEREAKAANRTVCSGCHLPYCQGECFTPVRFYGDKKLFEIGDVVETPEGTFTIGDPANPPKVHPKLTHWQRLKSWLGGWKVELLIVMLILGFLAGLVAFAYWPR